MVELFPIFYTSNQNLTFRKIGNSSTISLTVELFPIYAFELFSIYAIRTIFASPNNHCVYVFNQEGEQIHKFGNEGQGRAANGSDGSLLSDGSMGHDPPVRICI